MEVVCDRELMDELPSRLPPELVAAGAGRRTVLHAMHSASDALTFAVWQDGRLIRSLSLSPDDGIVEDIGDRLPFEAPYWAGEHPVESFLGDGDGYPLPFHPLELGEDALRALCGFIIEGLPSPEDVDAMAIELLGYRVEVPNAAEKEAALRAAVAAMGPPRRCTLGPDGRWVECSDPL